MSPCQCMNVNLSDDVQKSPSSALGTHSRCLMNVNEGESMRGHPKSEQEETGSEKYNVKQPECF